MKYKTPLLLTLLFLSSSAAFAASEGIYLGLNGVYGNIDVGDVTVNDTTYATSTNSTFGGGLNYGYQASKNVAIDGGLDGLNVVAFDGENAPTQTYWFSYLAIKPMLDIWKFDVFVSIGAAYVSIEQNNTGTTEDTTNAMVRPYGSAGFGINFSPSTEMSFSINRIQDTDAPMTFGMVALTYHFIERHENSGFLAD